MSAIFFKQISNRSTFPLTLVSLSLVCRRVLIIIFKILTIVFFNQTVVPFGKYETVILGIRGILIEHSSHLCKPTHTHTHILHGNENQRKL